MTESTPNHQQEARELSRAMTLEGVRWRRKNFHANEGQTTRDLDYLLAALSSRDREIREVLEGLVVSVIDGENCWCPDPFSADIEKHDPACLAARGLWERVQGTVSEEESDVDK